ncbi:hypothetical protein [Pectinatus haikarae]|uniref:Uncharacterized protein n=1 Tax=Pectinatus haikarae TaxID=349096 RepID=A0ABT9Y5Y2_9FIRM|nr:hypothetical protein [Pectinatus haikarae]MDQ0203124.1 hypothetical protein [Pectinatus haikarae]
MSRRTNKRDTPASPCSRSSSFVSMPPAQPAKLPSEATAQWQGAAYFCQTLFSCRVLPEDYF